jgi:crotonobetainyl-CoA:carnitine CoA-transferase CaiB-like acyl-CoA transferase
VTADGRAADADVLDGWIREWTTGLDRDSVTQACHEAGVPAAPVLDVPAVVQDPLTRERGMLHERPHPSWTTVRLTGVPVRLSRTPAGVRETLPPIGADNARVLRTVGSSNSLARLKADPPGGGPHLGAGQVTPSKRAGSCGGADAGRGRPMSTRYQQGHAL